MLTIDAAVNNFFDYIEELYQGILYYEITRDFVPFCDPFRKPDGETVGVGMAISVDYNGDATRIDSYGSSGMYFTSGSRQQSVKIVVIFENGQSSGVVKFSIDGPNRLPYFLSAFACFMCLNSEYYIASPELFRLMPDNVDLSCIIRAIEIDHNVELLSRMIEDIYHYCGDGSYEKYIGAMLDHFTSAEHNDPELTAVILNKRHELGNVDEDVPKLRL